MADWQYVHIGIEGDDLRIGGHKVWRESWRPVGIEPIQLPHPSYPAQIHRFNVYEIGDTSHSVRFAAQELSANVWGFYVPK